MKFSTKLEPNNFFFHWSTNWSSYYHLLSEFFSSKNETIFLSPFYRNTRKFLFWNIFLEMFLGLYVWIECCDILLLSGGFETGVGEHPSRKPQTSILFWVLSQALKSKKVFFLVSSEIDTKNFQISTVGVCYYFKETKRGLFL